MPYIKLAEFYALHQKRDTIIIFMKVKTGSRPRTWMGLGAVTESQQQVDCPGACIQKPYVCFRFESLHFLNNFFIQFFMYAEHVTCTQAIMMIILINIYGLVGQVYGSSFSHNNFFLDETNWWILILR